MQETGFQPDQRRGAYFPPVITEQKARKPCFLGEESRPLLFCPGIKDEILRHFVPQNDSGELFDKLEFN